MATYYIDPQGPAGSGTSAVDSRTTIPGYTNGDTLLFKRGSTYTHTGQLSITATGTTWEDYGAAAQQMPIFSSTATNFGSTNISTASGVTTFRRIHFKNYLSGSANGAVLVCAAPAVRVSSIKVDSCKFESCSWNAIKINGTTTATAALTFECIDSVFTDIGEDCVFGCALDFRFGRNHCTNISSRSATGDGVGMINGDPDFVWIYGNYIDHSAVDIKQCIIVDTSGAATGLVIIEDNVLIGYGSETQAATAHVIVICDAPLLFRRNEVFTAGAAVGTNHATDEITGNVIRLKNRDTNNSTIAINGTGSKVDNNTIIGHATLPATTRAVVMGTATSASVKNNIFLDVPIAIKSDSVGNNPTATNNGFYGVTSQRLDSSSNAFAGGSDVTTDPQLRGNYMPLNADYRSAGIPSGRGDFYGKEIRGTIGAVQYTAARTVATRTARAGSVGSRSLAAKRKVTA